MIDMPAYRIEPPDLVLIEVLEALPGRPISGERLVRPDGTVTLGFYGEVYVRGLTVRQVKAKIIKHLRRFLDDSVLGLISEEPAENTPKPPPDHPVIDKEILKPQPQPPDIDEDLFKVPQKDSDQPEKPHETPRGVSTIRSTSPVRAKFHTVSNTQEQSPAERPRRGNAPSDYFVRNLPSTFNDAPKYDDPPTAVVESAKTVEVRLQDEAEITIRINLKKGPSPEAQEEPTVEPLDEIEWISKPLPLDDSDRVFVDVTAYNSKHYYVLGDVAQPGKLPSTGNETVLEALQYAGGFVHTADPKKVNLVRPGRGGKPGKVYPVDLEAIELRGETATNYQLFPGDRIIVGRDKVVEKTIQIDRTSTAIQDVINSIRQEALMVRAVKEAAPDQPEVLIKNLVEFWIHELNRPEGAVFDEETLREVLLRSLNVKPDAPKAEK